MGPARHADQARAGDGAPGRACVALLDLHGVIVETNAVWDAFCLSNGGDLSRAGVGRSYLAVCDAAASDRAARDVATAIRAALSTAAPSAATIRVACHSPDEPRWFDVLVSSRLDQDGSVVGASVTLSPSALRQSDSVPVLPSDEQADLVRELADDVIKEVFGVGLRLRVLAESASATDAGPDWRGEADGLLTALDDVIVRLRSSLFADDRRRREIACLEVRLRTLAATHSKRLGTEASLSLPDELGVRLRPELAEDLLAAAQEALAHCAGSVGPAVIELGVHLRDDEVTLEVVEAGLGMEDLAASGGLVRLRHLAALHDGQVAMTRSPGGGCRLTWSGLLSHAR